MHYNQQQWGVYVDQPSSTSPYLEHSGTISNQTPDRENPTRDEPKPKGTCSNRASGFGAPLQRTARFQPSLQPLQGERRALQPHSGKYTEPIAWVRVRVRKKRRNVYGSTSQHCLSLSLTVNISKLTLLNLVLRIC